MSYDPRNAICAKCAEPWELYYLRNEGLWEHPGDDAPQALIDQHLALIAEDERLYQEHGIGYDQPKHDGQELVKAVMSGKGCPACWYDPDRVLDSEDVEMNAMEHNLLYSNWDGDPAELIP